MKHQEQMLKEKAQKTNYSIQSFRNKVNEMNFNMQNLPPKSSNSKYGVIQYTRDFDRFEKLQGNRGIGEYHVIKLIQSISDRGYLPDKPILVTFNDESGKYTVIDGQHRIEACRRLNCEIPYIEKKSGGFDDINAIHAVAPQLSWRMVDYINMRAGLGNKHYQYLKEFTEQFSDFNIRSIVAALSKSTAGDIACYYNRSHVGHYGSKSAGVALKLGEYTHDHEFAAELSALLNKLRELEPFIGKTYKSKGFIAAIMHVLLMEEDYDINLLVNKIGKYPDLLKSRTKKELLYNLEEIYNYKHRSKQRIAMKYINKYTR